MHRLKAQVLGLDALTNIALIKVDANGIRALKLADSDLVRVGQLAMDFGRTLGLENTFALGVISATHANTMLAVRSSTPERMRRSIPATPVAP